MRRVALAVAVAVSAAAGAAEPEIKFRKETLKNGLTVILSEDHRLPQVAVNIWYHTGAANQSPGKSGFAHLFEHMMFSGSKHVQPSPMLVLERIGVVGGSMSNGTTNLDRTNYFELVPNNELATALWIESDRMAFLLDTLDEQKLAVQRRVVSNERLQSYDNRPYGRAFLRTCSLLFPKPHPYFECVIGDIPEIMSASMEDLRGFFRTWYGPNNASLAIVGDFDPDAAMKLVHQYFDDIPRAPEAQRPNPPQPMLTQVVRETVPDAVAEVPRLQLTWSTGIRHYTDDEPAGVILADILAGGKTSRLYKLMVFDKQVASDVSAGSVTAGLGGWFTVAATAKTGHGADELLPYLQQVIDELKKSPPTEEELQRSQRGIVASTVRTMERLGGFGGKADLLNQYETYLDDPGYLPRDLARYRAVTPEQVRAFAQKYLPDDKRLELTVEPQKKGAPQTPKAAQPAGAPPAAGQGSQSATTTSTQPAQQPGATR